MQDLPIYPFPVTFLILSVVMIIRYFLLAGGAYLFTLKTRPNPIEKKRVSPIQIKRDIKWSVLSSLVFAFFGAILIEAWHSGITLIYLNPSEKGLWYLPVSFFVYLFLHDTYFYWTHRLLHMKSLRRFHLAHHESLIPTAWTSFSFHPVEGIIQSLILPVLVMVIPIHWTMFILFLLVMSVCGIFNHLGYEFYPSFFEKKLHLISATHHQIHHGRLQYNLGLYFTFWDKIMNTEWERP